MDGFDYTNPQNYRLFVEDRVRYGDLDAFGHTNNASIATYFDSARFALLEKIGMTTKPDSPLIGGLVQLNTSFRAELHYQDEIRIGISVLKLGTKSIRLASAIFRDLQCAAHAEAVLVPVNSRTRQGVELTEEMRQSLRPYMV